MIRHVHDSQAGAGDRRPNNRVGGEARSTPEPIEDRAAFGQAPERADLVSAHEAAVALNICCEDCDEASADFRRVGHAGPNGTLWRPVWAGGPPASSEG